MTSDTTVLVYGANGHTGRFVVDEVLRRGLTPVLSARTEASLANLPARYASLERRIAPLDDEAKVGRALAGAGVTINCAGPFIDTAVPLARAAVRAGVHYLDVTAEQRAVQDVYAICDAPAKEAGVAIIPAMAFFGGLADLLVTMALEGDGAADEVDVAVSLNRWWPTAGTRATGERNSGARQVIAGGRLVPMPADTRGRRWSFPGKAGEQAMVPLPLSEVITIHRHLKVAALQSYINEAPLDDLHDTETPPPVASDERGRSDQTFIVDVIARQQGRERRATVSGRDIYAVTGPLAVDAAGRLLQGAYSGSGAMAPGQAFDAQDVLHSLATRECDVTVIHAGRSDAE